jgi:hypothetical protein
MNAIVDEACVLSIVLTGTPRRVLQKENSLDILYHRVLPILRFNPMIQCY